MTVQFLNSKTGKLLFMVIAIKEPMFIKGIEAKVNLELTKIRMARTAFTSFKALTGVISNIRAMG